MVYSTVESTFFIKVFGMNSDYKVEILSAGSSELFFSPYNVVKNFEAKVKVVAKIKEVPTPIKILANLHSYNSHIEL